MNKQAPTESQEFQWRQPPRKVTVTRAEAYAVAAVVEGTLRLAKMELIPQWKVKVTLLVTSDLQEKSELMDRVERHNQRVRKYIDKHPELFPVSDTDRSLGSVAVSDTDLSSDA